MTGSTADAMSVQDAFRRRIRENSAGRASGGEPPVTTDPSRMRILHVPAGGIQTQASLDAKGILHRGTLVWQLFDSDGKPTKEKGQAPGVPVWSTVSVIAQPDGQFLILY
jgi:hypothetical protein